VRRGQTWSDAQRDLDPQRLAFIDETWASTNMARRCGRAPRGERLRCGVPHGHWKTTTFVAALRLTGMVAPMALDGPINGDCFQAYVEQFLAPTLKRGDVVGMDNLGSHKGAGVRAAIEAVGARLLYLRHSDVPLHFHPAAMRASADFAPSGGDGAMCGRPGWSVSPGRARIAVRLAA